MAITKRGVSRLYVDNAVASVAGVFRVRTIVVLNDLLSNINISNPGTAVINGVSLAQNDLLLLVAQTNPAENGVYVFNTSATPLVRHSNFDSAAELSRARLILVEEGGRYANSLWGVKGTVVTLGTDPVAIEILAQGNYDQPSSITGNLATSSPTISNVSDFTNLAIADIVTHANVPKDTFIIALDPAAGTITMSANATGNAIGAAITVISSLISRTRNVSATATSGGVFWGTGTVVDGFSGYMFIRSGPVSGTGRSGFAIFQSGDHTSASNAGISGLVSIRSGNNSGTNSGAGSGDMFVRSGTAVAGNTGVTRYGSGAITGGGAGSTGESSLLSGNASSGNSGVAVVGSGTSATGASGLVVVRTGNVTGGIGNSGDLFLQIGTSAGGSRGKLKIQDGSQGTVGHVWASTGTDGAGAWTPYVQTFTSAASAGGAPTEALVVTGLLATDTILAVTQMTPGANSLPLLGWSTVANNSITGIWSANPGAGAVLVVTVKR